MTSTAPSVSVDLVVKFGKETVEVTLPLTATVADVKARLAALTGVQADKQRLLLNAPVEKDKRRDPGETCRLQDLFSAPYVEKIATSQSISSTSSVAQHIRVTAMLIGSSQATPMVDSKAASEISRLVLTTVEHDGMWFRCCYGKGYLRQTAYVCRSCIQSGRADPAHAVCAACAEMCHGTHEVEEWGVRYCMRCDCCTRKCWRPTGEKTEQANNSNGAADHDTEARNKDGSGGAPSTAAVVASSDVQARVAPRHKRSRPSSPTTPKRAATGSGGSPVSGVRVAAVAAAPSPFSLQDQPMCETTAVTSPVAGTLSGQQQDRRSPSRPLAATVAVALTANAAARGTASQSDPAFPMQPISANEGDVHADDTSATPQRQPLPVAHRCLFVIDSSTGKPPMSAVLPVNARNRYPRNPLTWCFCKEDNPTDDPDCGGIVCMLCTSCFWSTHVTRLHTEQLWRVPCYGDVVQGDTIAFRCLDCNTYVCSPCSQRCHRDHKVEPQPIAASREDGTDNNAPPGVNFSCGCRGLCSIAETVTEEEVEAAKHLPPMSAETAEALMDNDVFTGFVCAHCMQEYPWLLTDDPRKCYHGQLPPKVTGSAIKPVIACGRTQEPSSDENVFPWHGMLLPASSFMEDATCGCAPCRAAYEGFAPRASEDAQEMIIELHDECDNCGVSLKGQPAYMCKTCEIALDSAFMICSDCNAIRLERVNTRATHTRPSVNSDADTVNNLEATSASTHSTAPAAANGTLTEAGEAEVDGVRPFKHSLEHEFMADTDDNVYALAGMQMMSTMDKETLAYLQNNWDSVKDQIQVSNTLVESFGQIPLNFTAEELEVMAEDNRRSTGSTAPREGADSSPAKKTRSE